MTRTKRESEGRREVARLVGAAEASGKLAEWCRLQRKNLSNLGLPKRKEWPQRHKVSSWQVRQRGLCQKKKEQINQSKSPNCVVGESQGERVPHLGEREGRSKVEHGEESVDTTVERRVPKRETACKENLSRSNKT